MKYYDQSDEINHNPYWSYILDQLYRIFIIGGSELGKNNVLLNINNQILIKYIYTSKIRLNQSINCLIMEEKM